MRLGQQLCSPEGWIEGWDTVEGGARSLELHSRMGPICTTKVIYPPYTL